MRKYRVAQLGLGPRGTVHANAFLELEDRYDLVGLCELRKERLEEYCAEKGLADSTRWTDAEKMLTETRPDVFCFVTQPDVRLSMVKLGAKYGVKAVAFEKPMAVSLKEASEIQKICTRNGIKGVVSHQQKYLTSLQRVKKTVDAGDLGRITHIEAHCQAWLSMLGTHFVDYMLWVNGGNRAKWVVGHAHGKGKLSDNHPSPDYVLGHVEFENGVRGTIQCGCLAPAHMGKDWFWVDNRLTVYGKDGYAWGDTEGRFSAFTGKTKGEVVSEFGPGYDPAKPLSGWLAQERTMLQPPYLAELADWLDDDRKVHSCNVDISYHGYEILEGFCISALDHKRVDLPLDVARCGDVVERMKKELPD